jgi:hypothetical protein
MESSKTVTSVFIVVALVALVALAVSIQRRAPNNAQPEADQTVLPGLTENLRSISRIIDFPADHIRSVRITRTDGEELAVERLDPASDWQFEAGSPEDIIPYTAILYANSAFLDNLKSPEKFAVNAVEPEMQLGKLIYTSFDGLVLNCTVFRASEGTWLRMTAAYSPKLAERFVSPDSSSLFSEAKINSIAAKLQGRLYKKPDSGK